MTYEGESPFLAEFPAVTPSDNLASQQSSEASTQASSSPFVIHPELNASAPTTPDGVLDDPFISPPPHTNLRRVPSDSTIGKASSSQTLPSRLTLPGNRHPATVPEEDADASSKPPPSPPVWAKAPSHPLRTPARTKRRSISSTLSEHSDGGGEKVSTPLPPPVHRDLDFASLLTQPTPIIFSTQIERDLLNTLSTLGFDTGQIVHSVLSNACDSAGAVWWMLKKKAERKALDDAELPLTATSLETPRPLDLKTPKKRAKLNRGIQTETDIHIPSARSAPQLAILPATPTTLRPNTPPRQHSPIRSPLLSPSSSTINGELSSSRSHPSTPAGSLRDKEKDKRKTRSGSVSIMQRATTALEAAGLVRKKSAEVFKEKDDKERDKSKDEPRSSHGSGGSSRLTKSPPLKPSKDKDYPPVPVTPPPTDQHPIATHMGSPWILTDSKDSLHHTSAVTPLTVGGQIQSHSTPNIHEAVREKTVMRPRANILTAFRHWFNEDRKGKRKDTSSASQSNAANYVRPFSQSLMTGTAKRRGSNSSGKYGHRNAHRAHRPSMSSRRSSSVNSRRSSGVPIDSPQIASRRSFGSHTPNSDRGEFSSRPSSIHSFSMQPRHRKSPSASSVSSAHFRTASPMQKYHRRGGSGSSTRVVRQPPPTHRGLHGRSNSTASSIHSPPSSRPTSWYEHSEGENTRTSSPLKMRNRSRDRVLNGGSMFIQKRTGQFMSPISYNASIGRSSWKKSWGLEPPGWQTRTTHLPIEVLAVLPATEPTTIRDVFSGRQSLSPADESDWVDEDEDIPVFAGGLGQMGASTSVSSSLSHNSIENTPVLSPPPRGNRRGGSKRANRTAPGNSMMSGQAASGGSRPKNSNERASPVPQEQASSEARGSRRQLPATRSGPAFRQAIQEEDEDEEEE